MTTIAGNYNRYFEPSYKDSAMDKQRILYVCTYTGARSLIAEFYTHQLANSQLDAFSASFECGSLESLSIRVMEECQMDLPRLGPKSVFDWFAEGQHFDFVVTLCQLKGNLQTALFTRAIDQLYGRHAKRLSWPVRDFHSLQGDCEAQLAQAREIRDSIRSRVLALHSTIGCLPFGSHNSLKTSSLQTTSLNNH